jgi:hypothetical protein
MMLLAALAPVPNELVVLAPVAIVELPDEVSVVAVVAPVLEVVEFSEVVVMLPVLLMPLVVESPVTSSVAVVVLPPLTIVVELTVAMLPVVLVSVTQQGAAPAELETQVARKVEDAVSGIAGVKHILSTLSDGRVGTVVEFQLETNVDRAINDVKDAIPLARAPAGDESENKRRTRTIRLPPRRAICRAISSSCKACSTH